MTKKRIEYRHRANDVDDILVRVAKRFVSFAIIGFGSEQDGIDAVQALLSYARFNATATCMPVFGGIWLRACSGRDGPDATAWLKQLTDTMIRGKVELEYDHVILQVEKRLAIQDRLRIGGIK